MISYEYLDYGLKIVSVALPIISHHSTFAYNPWLDSENILFLASYSRIKKHGLMSL